MTQRSRRCCRCRWSMAMVVQVAWSGGAEISVDRCENRAAAAALVPVARKAAGPPPSPPAFYQKIRPRSIGARIKKSRGGGDRVGMGDLGWVRVRIRARPPFCQRLPGRRPPQVPASKKKSSAPIRGQDDSEAGVRGRPGRVFLGGFRGGRLPVGGRLFASVGRSLPVPPFPCPKNHPRGPGSRGRRGAFRWRALDTGMQSVTISGQGDGTPARGRPRGLEERHTDHGR